MKRAQIVVVNDLLLPRLMSPVGVFGFLRCSVVLASFPNVCKDSCMTCLTNYSSCSCEEAAETLGIIGVAGNLPKQYGQLFIRVHYNKFLNCYLFCGLLFLLSI